MTDSKFVATKLRRLVQERAGKCCEYCRSQESYSPQSFSVEHVKPIFAGGMTESFNLAYSCQGCNSHKSVKTEGFDKITEETVNLFNPRFDTWKEHFSWSADFSEIIGLTAVGRVTVEILKMNRHGVVNMRKVLYITGKHPVAD